MYNVLISILSIKAQVWFLFTPQSCVEIMMTYIMFEHKTVQTIHTNTFSTLSGSHRTFSLVGAYSTSLSSRVIGSALVGRLKLQSRQKKKKRANETESRSDEREIATPLGRLFWSTLIRSDRSWNLRGWYGMIADKSAIGYWFTPCAFPISSCRFKGRRCSST